MNFVDLQCFVVAVEEMNFTRAAKRLFISQQSLSSHIAKLEDHYGIRLFDRTPPLTVTPAGNILLGYAQALINVERQAGAELEDLKGNYDCELRVGISSYRSNVMMPRLLPQFHTLYPNVRVKLLEAPLAQVTEALLKGRVNMVIGYEAEDGQVVQSDVLYGEEVKLLIPDSVLATCFSEQERENIRMKDRVSLAMFRNCPFIKLGEGTWLGEIVNAYSREGNIHFDVRFETVSITTMISLCMEGIGAVICPEIYLDEENLKQRNIHVFSLSEPLFRKNIAVNYIGNKYRSRAAKEFASLAREIFG